MTIKGTRGNDNLKGTAKADVFDLSLGGNDIVTALGGNDTFVFKGAFTAKDQINGGGGTDVLSLAGDYSNGVVLGAKTIVGVETITLGAHHDYKLTTNDANVAKNKTLTIDGSTLGAADTLTFNGSHETDGHFAITGGKGNDVLTGGALSDTFTLTAGGNDTANGGVGNDTFNLAAALTAADKINGGAGSDILNLNGTYTGAHALSFGATTVLGVEKILLAAGHSYSLTTADATVASGATLSVNASALGAANTLTFNGGAETNGTFHIIGGAGADVINMGGAFTSNDEINGGAGSDTVALAGDYSAGLTLAQFNITSVENLTLHAGFNYNLSLFGLTAPNGFTVDAHTLGAGDSLTLDASNYIGVLTVKAGAGNDVITSSTGGETDIYMGSHFTAADQITGAAGGSAWIILDGDTNVTLGANTISNLSGIELQGGHDYNLTLNAASTGKENVLSFLLDNAQDSDHYTIDASAETDTTLGFNMSLGHYVLTGSAGSDVIGELQADANTTATITGGGGGDNITPTSINGGSDIFVYNSVSDSTGSTGITIDRVADAHFDGHDHFELSGLLPASFVTLDNQTLDGDANFNTNMATIVAGHIGAHGEATVVVTDGTLHGNSYMVVDANGDSAYTAGQDYLINISNFSGTIDSTDFITGA